MLTGATTATKLGVEFRKARSRVGRGIWTEQETNPVRSGPWGTPAWLYVPGERIRLAELGAWTHLGVEPGQDTSWLTKDRTLWRPESTQE